MTRTIVVVGLIVGALWVSATGCGGTKSCVDVCGARESCPDVIPGDKSCELQCKDEEALVKLAGCEEQQSVFYECLSELTDQCEASTTCATEGSKRYGCFFLYCSKNPDVAGCATYSGQ